MKPFRAANRKRPPKRVPRLRLPAIDPARVMTVLLALGAVAAGSMAFHWLADRPVSHALIRGEFERVSADRIEAAVRPHMGRGFLALDLGAVVADVEALPWVAAATAARRWPDALEVTVREEQPAARWGDRGLLNARGRLFVEEATHIPAELPRLSGPPGSEAEVAAQFMVLQQQLVGRGMTLVELALDSRGAWRFGIGNGIVVHLGSGDAAPRIARFFAAFDDTIAGLAEEVRYVDMRYTNGFAIGWKQPGGTSSGLAAAGAREQDPDV